MIDAKPFEGLSYIVVTRRIGGVIVAVVPEGYVVKGYGAAVGQVCADSRSVDDARIVTVLTR